MNPANAAAAAPLENPTSVHTPTDIGLCGLNTRSMFRNRSGLPRSEISNAGRQHGTSGRNPAGVAHQLAVRAGVVGDSAYYSGSARRATDKEIKRNLPGPRRLFQQWNAVVAGVGRRLLETERQLAECP